MLKAKSVSALRDHSGSAWGYYKEHKKLNLIQLHARQISYELYYLFFPIIGDIL